MVRSHTIMVWSDNLPKKSLLGEWVGGIPNLVYSPGPGLWPLVLGPFGPDLGPDLDLTWDLDLDPSLIIPVHVQYCGEIDRIPVKEILGRISRQELVTKEQDLVHSLRHHQAAQAGGGMSAHFCLNSQKQSSYHLRSVLFRARNLSPPTSSITLYFSFSAILRKKIASKGNCSQMCFANNLPQPLLPALLLVVGDEVLGPGHLLGGGPHPSVLLPPSLPLTLLPSCLSHDDL